MAPRTRESTITENDVVPATQHHKRTAKETRDEVAKARAEEELAALRHNARMRQLAEEKIQAEINAIRSQSQGAPQAPTTATPLPDDDILGELLPPHLRTINKSFPGVQMQHFVAIYTHKFDPWNLHKLRTGIGSRATETRATPLLDPATNKLYFEKPTGKAKDFGDDSVTWTACFVTYTRIISSYWGTTHPALVPAMLHFLSRVLRLAETYLWPKVLDFAISWHQDAIATGPLAPEAWHTISQEFQDYFFTQDALRSIKKAKSDVSLRQRSPNDSSQSCENYNSAKGCSADWCKRSHTCRKCKATGHGATTCKK